MSIVKRTIRKLTNTIPIQLLNEAFSYDYHLAPTRQLKLTSHLPIETHIEDEVWTGMVYHDINDMAGQSVEIELGGITPKPYVHTRLGNISGMVFHVPEHLRDGRNILSVTAASSNLYNVGGNIAPGANYGRTFLDSLANKMLDHATGVQGQTTPPTIAYIGCNNILVYGNYLSLLTLRVRCDIENDINLSNFDRNASNAFYLLMEQATKMMIYNRLSIPIDQARLEGGFELGRFREILDGYSDADKLYQELLAQWPIVALFNDDEDYHSHLNLISGGVG